MSRARLAKRRSGRLGLRAAEALLLGISLSPGAAAESVPRIFFTDVTSGPSSGGQDDAGAFVTLRGVGFGATRGSSRVTVGGGEVSKYVSWADDAVVVQLGANAKTGDVRVDVAGNAQSNGVPFTVRPGGIYFVSPDGVDTQTGTFAAPFKTLDKAAKVLVAGDTLYVRDASSGQFQHVMSSSLALPSGTSADPIAIVRYPGAKAAISSPQASILFSLGSFTTLAGLELSGSRSALRMSSGDRLVGCDISCTTSSGGDAGYGCVDTLTTSALTDAFILGNVIHDAGVPPAGAGTFADYAAIKLTGPKTSVVAWNRISGGRCHGLMARSGSFPASGFDVHSNVMSQLPGVGVYLGSVDAASGPVRAFNNVFDDVGRGPVPSNGQAACILVLSASSVPEISHNTFHGCGSASSSGVTAAATLINAAGAVGLLVRNNVAVSSSSPFVAGAGAGVSGANNLWWGAAAPSGFQSDITKDPAFVSASTGDFRLTPSSPAIDVGLELGVGVDLAGTVRPQGAGFDLGAYELPVQAGLGETCAAGAECPSGFCVDGVCCDSACTAPCQACSAAAKGAGASGLCGPVTAGQDPDDDCSEEPVSSCGRTGACDGAGACQRQPSTVSCFAPACEAGGQSVVESFCDGQGTCAPKSTSCFPFACDSAQAACHVKCTTSDQCAQNSECSPTGVCVSQLTCDGDHTVTTPSGTVDCTPFRCTAEGCRTSCSSVADCAAGFVCGDGSKCVASASSSPTGDGGCGCAAPRSEPARGALALLFGAALLFARRRRPRS